MLSLNASLQQVSAAWQLQAQPAACYGKCRGCAELHAVNTPFESGFGIQKPYSSVQTVRLAKALRLWSDVIQGKVSSTSTGCMLRHGVQCRAAPCVGCFRLVRYRRHVTEHRPCNRVAEQAARILVYVQQPGPVCQRQKGCACMQSVRLRVLGSTGQYLGRLLNTCSAIGQCLCSPVSFGTLARGKPAADDCAVACALCKAASGPAADGRRASMLQLLSRCTTPPACLTLSSTVCQAHHLSRTQCWLVAHCQEHAD